MTFCSIWKKNNTGSQPRKTGASLLPVYPAPQGVLCLEPMQGCCFWQGRELVGEDQAAVDPDFQVEGHYLAYQPWPSGSLVTQAAQIKWSSWDDSKLSTEWVVRGFLLEIWATNLLIEVPVSRLSIDRCNLSPSFLGPWNGDSPLPLWLKVWMTSL